MKTKTAIFLLLTCTLAAAVVLCSGCGEQKPDEGSFQHYGSGKYYFNWLGPFKVGTNTDSSLDDVVELKLVCAESVGDNPTFRADFDIRGPSPLQLSAPSMVTWEIDGRRYSTSCDGESYCMTNVQRGSMEMQRVNLGGEILNALADAPRVQILFEGQWKTNRIDATPKAVSLINRFARRYHNLPDQSWHRVTPAEK